ncbi:MAG: hypothetical protein JXR61_10825 [Prolixibacteraceae bacterium]|nr:hypothetical protein [Prolixibacteraceae bacterium]
MKPKKEHYRRKLPHFQQPGQWYSVTFTLKGAMPKGAMEKYASALETARTRYLLLAQESGFPRESDFPKSDTKKSEFPNSDISNLRLGKSQSRMADAKKKYQTALRKYRLAYDKILNKSTLPGINLVKDETRKIIEEALLF